jgi:hypothetical protein
VIAGDSVDLEVLQTSAADSGGGMSSRGCRMSEESPESLREVGAIPSAMNRRSLLFRRGFMR